MSNPTELMNQIEETIKSTGPAQSRFLACAECNAISMWQTDQPLPTTCPTCKKPAHFAMGMSITEAREKAKTLTTPAKPEPAKPEVAVEPVVKRTRRARPQAATPANTEAVGTETTHSEESVADLPMGAVAVEEPVDFAALRKKSIEKLITARGLNRVEFRPVGKAVVYGTGFTRWVEAEHGRVPEYCIREPGSDELSYRAELKEARKHDGTVCTDTAQLTDIAPVELVAVLFRGQCFASTMRDNGPLLVKTGDSVEVGARVTANGGLTYRVLRVL